MDTSIADELLDPTSPLHEETADMTSRLAEVYQVHVLLDSPSGVRPELPGVEPLAVLPYSTAGGRSSLARALQCQLHVEMALVSPNEQVTLFDRRITSSADADEELKQYFGRLEQLAAAVDALALVLVPDNTAEGDTERDWSPTTALLPRGTSTRLPGAPMCVWSNTVASVTLGRMRQMSCLH